MRKAQQEAVKEQAAGKPVTLTDAIWRTALSEGNWMVELYDFSASPRNQIDSSDALIQLRAVVRPLQETRSYMGGPR